MFQLPRSCLVLPILAILAAGCTGPYPASPKLGVNEGDRAPALEGVDVSGKPLKLSDFRGKVVMLDFWATWCPPCMELVPHERELVANHKNEPFVLLGVSVDRSISDIEKVEQNGKVTWRNWWFEGRERDEVLKTWRVEGFPTIILIDHNGIIQHRWYGNPGFGEIDKEVNKLIQDAKQYARSRS
jgi:thiol-disulfide isomerase/thioredoxin